MSQHTTQFKEINEFEVETFEKWGGQ